MFCANCGAQIDDDSTFCGSCGRLTSRSVAKPEEQTVPFAHPRTIPADPLTTAPHSSVLPVSHPVEEPVTGESGWFNKYKQQTIVIGALVIVIAIGGIFACKARNDRKLEAAEKARIAKQAEDDAAKARIAKQAKEAQKVIIAAEEALAASKQDRIEAEKARAAAEQARIAKQAEEAQKARIAAEKARAAEEKAEEALKMKRQLEEIQKKRQAAPSASKPPVAPASGKSRTSANPPPASNAISVNLATGTAINVITSSMISTEKHGTGDGFEAILNEDITYDGRVVARRGSTVKGVISESDPGGRVKNVATISLRLTSLILTDGRSVSVTTNTYTESAPGSVGKDVAKVGIGAGIGAAIGAIAGGGRGAAIGAAIGGATGTGTALATRGDPAVIAPETRITFNLTLPLNVTLR